MVPDGQGARRSLPTKPLLRAPARFRTGILNRAPGNNSTLDNLFLPRSLGPIVNSDSAVHNPSPQHRWAGTKPMTSRWNASESLSVARRRPHDTRSTKETHPEVETALNQL